VPRPWRTTWNAGCKASRSKPVRSADANAPGAGADISSGGTISLDGTTFINNGTATWAGGGTVTLTDGADFINNGSLVVAQGGYFGDSANNSGAALDNHGTIEVMGSGTTTFQLNVTNERRALIQADGGGTLILGGYQTASTYDGVVQQKPGGPGASVEFAGRSNSSNFAQTSSISFDHVTFDGTDVVAGNYNAGLSTTISVFSTVHFTGNVENVGALDVEYHGAADFSPANAETISATSVDLTSGTLTGNSHMVLNDSGDYTQDAGSGLNLTLGGSAPGTGYGQINVAGAVSLAGQFNLSLAPSFTPRLKETFTIIQGQSINGPFAGLPGGFVITLGGNQFQISYAGNAVTLTAIKVLPQVSVSDTGGTYNGSAFPATATVTGDSGTPGSSLEGVGLTLDYQQLDSNGNVIADLGSNAPVNAGSYQVIATYAGDANHTASSSSATFTIAQATLTVNTNSSLMLVGNSPPALTGSVNGTPFTGAINYTTAYGDIVTVTLSTTATSASRVGQDAITATLSGASAGNYVIDPTTSTIGTMYVVSLGADPTSTTGARAVIFWDNKGNARLITAADLSSLNALNLVTAGGSDFDPKTVAQLQAWLSSSNTTPAFQLSVQLAAMDLNVLTNYVKATDLVYAGALLPFASADHIAGLTSGGFIDVQDLMQAANAALAQVSPSSAASDPNKAYELALAQVLQAANGNSDFVQQELVWNLLALYPLLPPAA
jgi:hypothetical protein